MKKRLPAISVNSTLLPHSQVKCRNCGAFGHLATSKWCPMKSWAGAVAPQPLGSKKKENLEPRRPQDFQTPAFFNEAVREQEPEPRWGILEFRMIWGGGTPSELILVLRITMGEGPAALLKGWREPPESVQGWDLRRGRGASRKWKLPLKWWKDLPLQRSQNLGRLPHPKTGARTGLQGYSWLLVSGEDRKVEASGHLTWTVLQARDAAEKCCSPDAPCELPREEAETLAGAWGFACLHEGESCPSPPALFLPSIPLVLLCDIVLLLGKSHGWRSLAGYSPQGC